MSDGNDTRATYGEGNERVKETNGRRRGNFGARNLHRVLGLFRENEEEGTGMNRRDLIKLAASQTAMAALPSAVIASSASAEAENSPAAVTLKNAQFELSLTPGNGFQSKLVHLPTGTLLADGYYSYSFATPHFSEATQDASSVVLRGTTETGIAIQHRFTVDPTASWMEEAVELTNRGAMPLDLHDVRSGFVLPIPVEEGKVQGVWANYKLTAIPFRREPNGHRSQYADFTLSQILAGQYSSELWTMATTVTSAFASEGWAWTDGHQGFLISKFSPGGLEFAILDRVALPENEVGFRWGGIGIYRGNPEHGAWLLPGGDAPLRGDAVNRLCRGLAAGLLHLSRRDGEERPGSPARIQSPDSLERAL